MGIIRAAMKSVGGTLADQWLEVIEADSMDNRTILTGAVTVRRDDKRNQNKRGTADVITDGSVIHVAENQFMILTDGGKIVDYSAEPGYYTVQTGTAPSLFGGDFKDSLNDAFSRLKFAGVTPAKQKVYFVNLQEIRDIPFGTPSPINYFDNFYNAELYLRANGYYSVRVVNPLLFYAEMGARTGERVTAAELQKSCLAEFLTAFQTSIARMSAEGERISHVGAKSMEVAKVMSTVLDEDWTNRRGMMIESVGINTISYDDSSKKLIDMRNQGAMLSDPTVREGYVQGAAARGIEAAGSNSAGAAAAFMGVNMGMNTAGGFVQAAGATNQAQMAQQQAAAQAAAPTADGWTCPGCGKAASGNFCSGCGGKKPEAAAGGFCSNCGQQAPAGAAFCSGCGNKLA